MQSFVLQDWITIRGTDTTSVLQTMARWLDLAPHSDVVLYLEVREVTNPGAGSVQLSFETSPTGDEGTFQAMATVTPTAGKAPTIVKVLLGQNPTVPLARFVRWRLAGTVSGTWDIAFRVTAVAGKSSNGFVPSSLAGCILWCRSDYGLTLVGGGVASWADQSGQGNDLVQTAVNNRPTLNTSDVQYAGQPSLAFDAPSGHSLVTANSLSLGPFTVAMVVKGTTGTGFFWNQYLAAHQNSYLYASITYTVTVYKDPPNVSARNLTTDWGISSTPRTQLNLFDGTDAGNILRLNGVTQTLTGGTGNDPGTALLIAPFHIMASGNGATNESGTLAEVVICNRSIASDELATLESYFRQRYGHY